MLLAALHHVGVPGFGGGFGGVDVLFVLSGYFATHLLAREYGATGALDVAACRLARCGGAAVRRCGGAAAGCRQCATASGVACSRRR